MFKMRVSLVGIIHFLWSLRSLAMFLNLVFIVLACTSESNQKDNHPLLIESTLRSILFTLLACHETTGNTMAFALIILAVFPEYQRHIQEGLDRQLGVRSWEE